MEPDPDLPGRLKSSSAGLGEATQTDIERRAAELAQMDGRDAFTDEDLARAAAELGSQTSSEASAGIDPTHRQRVPLENETNLGEQLIQQGMTEADHNQRVAASEADEV